MDDNTKHPLLLPVKHYHPLYKYLVRPIIILEFPALILIRLCCMIPLLLLSALCDYLINLGTDQSKPLSPRRTRLYILSKKLFYKPALFIAGWLLIVRGKPSTNVKAIMLNHCSALDILAVAASGVQSSVAKAELSKNIFFSATLKVTRSILARSGKGTEQIAERFEESGWPPLGAFPAGTTCYQNVLPKLRSGMFLKKPTIELASIKYFSLENPFDIVGIWKHIFGVTAGLFGVIYINFYPEEYSANEEETPQEYAERIGEALAFKSGAVQTPYTYKDLLWFEKCGHFTESDLSMEYKRDQLWRGNIDEWSRMCRESKRDPLYAWTKKDLGIL